MLRSVDLEKCVGCGACMRACPFDVYRLDTEQQKTSPCNGACPANINLRRYIYLLQLGNHAEAAKELFARNPLPLLTCLLCGHFCEKSCTRKQIDAPVNIPALENYLGEWAMEHGVAMPPVTRAGKIAVAGSGAAGLAAAWFMRLFGFEVDIHEKEATAGGSLRKEAPADILQKQLDFLAAHGISIITNSIIGDGHELTPRGLLAGKTRALIIATGPDTVSEFASVVDIKDEKAVSDPVTRATRTNGVFVTGRAAGAPAGVAFQIGDAYEAAWSANCFANGWDMLQGRPKRKREVASMPVKELFQYSEELPNGNLPPFPRNECRQDEIFPYETAMAESRRCVTCGAKSSVAYKNDCMTCFFCEIACPVNAILVDPRKEEIPRTIEFKREEI